MLHDALPTDVVDAEAAMEFMKEATKLATVDELQDIGQRLEHKSRLFREALERPEELDEEAFQLLVGRIFSLRRKGKRLIRQNGLDHLRGELRELVHGDAGPAARLDRFVEAVTGLERLLVISFATEILHFSDPRRYWLWTPWIWNPATSKGSLPLVTRAEVDLDGGTSGEIYEKVGRAMARVDAAGQAAGYSRTGRGLFGTDVFLACVYAVYMYTVFRVKMSREFNRILPELPELVERVLGTHRLSRREGS